MNPRSLFLFPAIQTEVHAVRDALIEALDHDVTFSSAVNTILAYGIVSMSDASSDRERVGRLLEEVDIFADSDDPRLLLEAVQRAVANRFGGGAGRRPVQQDEEV